MSVPADAMTEIETLQFQDDLNLGTGTKIPHCPWISDLMSGTAKATWEGLEGSRTDNTLFGVPAYTRSVMTLKRLSSRATPDAFVQALLKVIDLALPPEPSRKLAVYQSIIDALSQKIIEIEQFATYERHEPSHITNAFLRAMNTTSPSREEHLPIYTDEELNRF